MHGEMPSTTAVILVLQSLVFLPAACALVASAYTTSFLTSSSPPPSSQYQRLHRLRSPRHPSSSSSSSLAFSNARRNTYVQNAESSTTASISIRAVSIHTHVKLPVSKNYFRLSSFSGSRGSGDDYDDGLLNIDSSNDIPYEILPLAEVIRSLAPHSSSSSSSSSSTHDESNSKKSGNGYSYNIGKDSGNTDVGNRFDDGNGSRKDNMESPMPSLPLLSDAQAYQRLRQYGPNILPSTRKQLSLWEVWRKQFEEDVLAKILACAALVSVISSLSDVWNDVTSSIDSAAAAAGGGGVVGVEGVAVDISSSLVHSLIEPLAIIAILVLNAGVGAWQEISAQRSLEALEAMQPRVATVLRRYYDDVGNDEDDDATITNISSNSKCNQNDHNDMITVPPTTTTTETTTAATATTIPPSTTATARWISNYDATHLVPGDVIRLRAGNAIPADARLLSLQSSSSSSSSYSSYSSLLSSSSSSSSSYSSMDVDESSLTGESGSVMKFPGDVIPATVGSVTIQNDNHRKKSEDKVDDNDGSSSSIKHELAPGATITSTTAIPIPIQDQSSMLFSGCLITRGSGTALVVRTGPNTQMGKIRSATIEAESEGAGRRTPLGDQLQQFGHVLSYAIGGICIAIWIASIPHFSDPAFATSMEGAVYYAKVGVALGVAAIPEGLPSAITLCLSLGARRMAGRNAIVRRLASVETLGCTSVICTDKTGTLTTNQMTAVSFLSLEDERGGEESVGIVEHEVTGNSYNPSGSVVGISREETIRHPLGSISDACDVMTLCNDARLFAKSDDDDDSNAIIDIREKPSVEDAVAARFAIEGEPTEAALLCLVEKLGPRGTDEESEQIPSSTVASQNYDFFTNRWDRYATLEFDRKRKSMGVLVAERDASDTRMADGSDWSPQCRLLVKGAPGTLLDRCSHAKLRDGSIIPISAEVRVQIESAISSIGNRALRCIALAVKGGDSLDANLLQKNGQYDDILKDSSKYIDVESGLTFVGMVAIKDPPRPGVSESIDECKRAGIRVIMITGDAKATAVAIAKDVHIFHGHNGDDDATTKAFESREFFAMPNSMQLEILKSDNLVICRAEPTDKRQLVKMLQSLGEIPAMTGDGVNDAPALVQASIGIAMGISGTEVAKEASDMVLVDDNFSTIVNAVEEGRCIYANMQAFINFLITCNIGEVIGVFLASLLGFPQLLSPLHLLCINLATDGPPATALGFNPPDPELMNKKPRPISDELLTPTLLFRYASAGLYIGVATVGIYASYFLDHGISLEQLSSWSTCTDSALCSIYTDLAAPQTLAFTTLVTIELLKALCTVSVDSSILKVGPQKNPWLLLGVAVPFAFNLAIIYTPAFQSNFGLVSLSREDWVHVLMWSTPIVLIDELQKLVSRYQERRKAAGQSTRVDTKQ